MDDRTNGHVPSDTHSTTSAATKTFAKMCVLKLNYHKRSIITLFEYPKEMGKAKQIKQQPQQQKLSRKIRFSWHWNMNDGIPWPTNSKVKHRISEK